MNINRENYEEYLFDYLEGNLSAEQAAEVKKQIDADPFLQAELKAFEQTVLKPAEDVIFPNKEALLKKDENRKIIPLYYYIATGVAAAIAILAIVYLPKGDMEQPTHLATNPTTDTLINTPSDRSATEEDFIKEEAIGTETQLTDVNSTTSKEKDNTLEDKQNEATGKTPVNNKLEPIYADMIEYNLREGELEVTNRIAFILPVTPENTAINDSSTDDKGGDADTYTMNRFRLKQELFDGVGSIFANIKKPKLTLFTHDDQGNRKWRMVFQYDTYSAIIRVR